MNLVDLKLPRKSEKERSKVNASMDQPTYPYWSRFSIEDEQIGKFPGLEKSKLGDKVVLNGIGEVVEVRKVDRQNEKNTFTVEVQMKKISIEPSKTNPMKGSLSELTRKIKGGKFGG